MQTKLTLRPGQNGTKKWVVKYGNKLVNVRYRYDDKNRKRYTTIEIIVNESTWAPRLETTHRPSDLLGIQVAAHELEIREKVKHAGGIWRPRQKLWELSYREITVLGLENRIVETATSR